MLGPIIFLLFLVLLAVSWDLVAHHVRLPNCANRFKVNSCTNAPYGVS
jgi:hypothetical protein